MDGDPTPLDAATLIVKACNSKLLLALDAMECDRSECTVNAALIARLSWLGLSPTCSADGT
jgi:hypothetical protein